MSSVFAPCHLASITSGPITIRSSRSTTSTYGSDYPPTSFSFLRFSCSSQEAVLIPLCLFLQTLTSQISSRVTQGQLPVNKNKHTSNKTPYPSKQRSPPFSPLLLPPSRPPPPPPSHISAPEIGMVYSYRKDLPRQPKQQSTPPSHSWSPNLT